MNVVSLFSGAGGMDLGFKQAGLNIIWANDISKSACDTYELNLGLKPLCADIRDVNTLPRAEILVACNPCQGFSLIGKRRPEDTRNYLYREIFRCLKIVEPELFIVENVKGLLYLYKGEFLKKMISGFTKYRYDVSWQVLNAKDYGVPQSRERIIIVGVKKDLGLSYSFPSPTHGPGSKHYVTLRRAIGKMPYPHSDDCQPGTRWSSFYMSRNRRAGWDDVSFTIQTNGTDIPLHPGCPPMRKVGVDKFVFTKSARRYRRLSTRECSKIQSFPSNFRFIGPRTTRYRLIGNAVPPLLAKAIAESIKIAFKKSKAVGA